MSDKPVKTGLKHRLRFCFWLMVGGQFLVCLYLGWWVRNPAALNLNILDVGQGDALLIDTPGHRQILIDGGPDDAVLAELGKVIPLYDRRIELVIVSHHDADHIAGLFSVLKRYEVGAVIEHLPNGPASELAAEWVEQVDAEEVQRIIPQTGLTIDLGAGFELELFAPPDPAEDSNNNSVVVKLHQAGQCLALLTGDAELPEEEALAKSNFLEPCQVLKVGHHGSRTATGPELLDKVKPAEAVISVGSANRFEHPHQEVLDRLNGAILRRTDREGTIRYHWQ